jgi:hypothetical protein
LIAAKQDVDGRVKPAMTNVGSSRLPQIKRHRGRDNAKRKSPARRGDPGEAFLVRSAAANRRTIRDCYFDAFSSREPVSTSLENAFERIRAYSTT